MIIKIKFTTLIILVIFIFVAVISAFLLPGARGQLMTAGKTVGLIQVVQAAEMYPMFLCPCCGKILDPKNICCPMAQEMITFIDALSQKGMTKNEAVLEFVKKYGLNSFADKEKQKEFQAELVKAAPSDRPIIVLNQESRDLGDVSQEKGIVSTLFEIKNGGKKDLIINKMDSSCGCTSASIIFQGVEGPRFAMAGHGIVNPTNWQVAIPSGQTAELKIYYDPTIHSDLRGAVTREINIFSNDPIDFEKKVIIELNQVD